MELDYYEYGYNLAKSGRYGFGIGGKIRAYEESFGESVQGGTDKWIRFLKGFDSYLEEINFFPEIQ
jgi:hypothetical protein